VQISFGDNCHGNISSILPLVSLEQNVTDDTLNLAVFNVDTDTSSTSTGSTLQLIYTNDLSLVGKYCVVLYDKKPYPRRIVSLDETDVEVECMQVSRTKYDTSVYLETC